MKSNFMKCLKLGHQYEEEAQKYFLEDLKYSSRNSPANYDFKDINNDMYEVKADKKAIQTDNICIEADNINNSQCKYYIYFIIKKRSHDCYKIPVEEIKKMIHGLRTIKGGDNKRMTLYLLPLSKIEDYIIYPIPELKI